jgi:hypothetical protein
MSTFLRGLVRSEDKSCDGKNKFPRLDSAERAAVEMGAKKQTIFEAYKCSFCDGFHIGHKTNFAWIPQEHTAHRLMINRHACSCGFDWLNSTTISTRLLTHFPSIISETEQCIICPICKRLPVEVRGYITFIERRWINLEDVSPDSTETLMDLWPNAVSTLTGLDQYAIVK